LWKLNGFKGSKSREVSFTLYIKYIIYFESLKISLQVKGTFYNVLKDIEGKIYYGPLLMKSWKRFFDRIIMEGSYQILI